MSETVQALKDGVSWVCGMTLLSEDTEIRPASLSYVKPSEYRMSAENLIARLYAALATTQRERAEWEANAERENAMLVQAQQERDKAEAWRIERERDFDEARRKYTELQQRIAALEAEAQDVRKWLSAHGRHTGQCNMVNPVPFTEKARAAYYAKGCTCGLDAALGRMLKEGE